MPRKSTKQVELKQTIDEPEDSKIFKSALSKIKLTDGKPNEMSAKPSETSAKPSETSTKPEKAIEEKAQKAISEKLFNVQKNKDRANVSDFVSIITNIGLNYKSNEQTPAINQMLFVPPDKRRTKSTMTKFEFCRVLSIRAQQIENGSPIFVDIGNLTKVNEIAMKEIKDKKCPLCVQRVIHNYPNGNKLAEIWEVEELAIPDGYADMKF